MKSTPVIPASLAALVVGVGVLVGSGGSAQAAQPSPSPSLTLAATPWVVVAREAESESESGRKWITHRVVPKETYDTIGARYGVSRAEIIRWNKRKLGKKQWIYAGMSLRINARKLAPPREKIDYTIRKGDTWGKVAKRFGVPKSHLIAWNPKVASSKKFIAGRTLKIYTDPKAPPPGTAGGSGTGGTAETPLPEFHVRTGGVGVGKPNRGRLVNGVQLPKSDMVKILDEDKVWGTSHAIEHLQEAIAVFRRDTGFDKPLTVSSISLKKGGRFRPHSSHQTGRDVDIRLPRKPGAGKGSAPSSVDWTLTWRLVESLVATGEVEYIFVSWSRQKYLRRAAQSAGATRAQLDKIIQYPRKPKTNKGIVRHSPGHDVHLHVRFTCTPGNSRCVSY